MNENEEIPSENENLTPGSSEHNTSDTPAPNEQHNDFIPKQTEVPKPFESTEIPSSVAGSSFGFSTGLDLGFIRDKVVKAREQAGNFIIGQEEMIDLLLIGIFTNGHILLEGVPGIAKTLSSKVLAKTLDTGFSRIQFTPDLMPSDIIGTSVFNMKTSDFDFIKGPIFSNIILIDEINRAPAKTQAALFEVMEERQITFEGTKYKMGTPFLVVATQNPVEQEGTYNLPEAQLDRFLFKIILDYPSLEEENLILQRYQSTTKSPDLSSITTVFSVDDIKKIQDILGQVKIENQLLSYIAQITNSTRSHGKLYLGASPRASLNMVKAAKAMAAIRGRDFITPDDIQSIAFHVLNHRVILTPEAEMEGLTAKDVVDEIVQKIEVPR